MNVQSRIVDGDDRPLDAVNEPAAGRRRWLIAAGVVLLVLVVLALALRGRAKPAVAAVDTRPHVTVTVPGHSAIAATVSATGQLAARRDMPVGVAGEGGRVVSVLVEPGQWVAAGQTLAVIDRSVQSQQAAQLGASIDVALADAALAQSNLDRARSLVGRGFISKADLDAKISTRDAANARVAVARAQLGETRALIGRLNVQAPAAGLVLTRAVEAGQIVNANSPALFRIAKEGELEMQARLAEQDLARLAVGRPAQITPVGSPRSYPGTIWQMSPIIDPLTRQGVVRIALHYDPGLRPGGFATAAITSGAVDAPLLPESAVMSDDNGNFVYVVVPGDKVARRDVKVGQVSDRGISIQSGLSGTEQVVVSAGAFLNPGDRILPERRAAVAGAR